MIRSEFILTSDPNFVFYGILVQIYELQNDKPIRPKIYE